LSQNYQETIWAFALLLSSPRKAVNLAPLDPLDQRAHHRMVACQVSAMQPTYMTADIPQCIAARGTAWNCL